MQLTVEVVSVSEGVPGIHGHPEFHSKFQARLGDMKLCLKKSKLNNRRRIDPVVLTKPVHLVLALFFPRIPAWFRSSRVSGRPHPDSASGH